MKQKLLDEAAQVIEDAVAQGAHLSIKGDFVSFAPPPNAKLLMRIAACDKAALFHCAEVFLEDLPATPPDSEGGGIA